MSARWFPDAAGYIDLYPSDKGGLIAAMPSGTRSLMFVFPEGHPPGVKVGAAIDVTDARMLVPGSKHLRVVVRFWDEAVADFIGPGSRFKLWYAKRIVGEGYIEDVALRP